MKTWTNLPDLFERLDKIRETSSRKGKESLLKEMIAINREITEQIFAYGLHPFWNYCIRLEDSQYMPESDTDYEGFYKSGMWKAFVSLLEDLKVRKLTGNKAYSALTDFLSNFPPGYRHWFKCIVNQNLRIGISGKTIKKYFPGLLPETTPMLCSVLDPKDGQRIADLEGWLMEPKYDGLRCLAIKEKGQITFYSRTGKDQYNTHIIEAQLQELEIDNVVFDGELLADDWNKTTSIVHTQTLHKDVDKLRYYVFDMIPLKDWQAKKTLGLLQRKVALSKIMSSVSHPNVRQVPSTELEWKDDFDATLKKHLSQGFEGSVVKDPLSEYEWKRSDSWLKVKPYYEDDFEIFRLEEGNGKNVGRLGAIWVKGPTVWKGKTLKIKTRVGSGFSDDIREELWAEGADSHGGKVQVEFQEVSSKKDAYGNHALRFPVFVRRRKDKK